MKFLIYISLIILFSIFIKFLISYIEKINLSLNNKIIESQISLGLFSIKDLQKDNYETFIKIIKMYLVILDFKKIYTITDNESNKINFKCISNDNDVLISYSQNSIYGKENLDEDYWETTDTPDIQSFLGRMYINDCKKGIFITNSYFSNLAIDFVNNFNNKNQNMEIKLINGYELTKSIRNHKYYMLKEELLNEAKYTI